MTVAYVNTYTHSVAYVTDQLLTSLKDVIREIGLSPEKFADSWPSSSRAMRAWLESKHLYKIALEIYDPNDSDKAILVPEFDVDYDYDGDGSFWVDGEALRYEIRKQGKVPSACRYSLILYTHPGEPHVDGWGPTDGRSRAGMRRYATGTSVGAPGLGASAAVWTR